MGAVPLVLTLVIAAPRPTCGSSEDRSWMSLFMSSIQNERSMRPFDETVDGAPSPQK
jgi:hypothetical protein